MAHYCPCGLNEASVLQPCWARNNRIVPMCRANTFTPMNDYPRHLTVVILNVLVIDREREIIDRDYILQQVSRRRVSTVAFEYLLFF